MTMTPEIAEILRTPFPASMIGKLPRVTCRECSRGQCSKHQKAKCRECGNFISTQHIHLDYVGHAATTDRLLKADPGWTWEPIADPGSLGLPTVGGMEMWVRLTVAGVTRFGYGATDKGGPDAVKEVIGDALRNAAMRFGVALDLWSKEDLEWHDDTPDSPPPARPGGDSKSRAKPATATEHDRRVQEIADEAARIAARSTEVTVTVTAPEGADPAALAAEMQASIADALASPAAPTEEPPAAPPAAPTSRPADVAAQTELTQLEQKLALSQEHLDRYVKFCDSRKFPPAPEANNRQVRAMIAYARSLAREIDGTAEAA